MSCSCRAGPLFRIEPQARFRTIQPRPKDFLPDQPQDRAQRITAFTPDTMGGQDESDHRIDGCGGGGSVSCGGGIPIGPCSGGIAGAARRENSSRPGRMTNQDLQAVLWQADMP
jgi:hypothetical protein